MLSTVVTILRGATANPYVSVERYLKTIAYMKYYLSLLHIVASTATTTVLHIFDSPGP
jgi:hypothetical protein